MTDGLPTDGIVIRFPPGGPDDVQQVRKEAKYANRHRPEGKVGSWFRLSVWLDSPRQGEQRDDVIARLVSIAGMHGIETESDRNAVVWTSTVRKIQDGQFTLRKDETPGEPREHWSVDLGPDPPDTGAVQRFVALFEGPAATREL